MPLTRRESVLPVGVSSETGDPSARWWLFAYLSSVNTPFEPSCAGTAGDPAGGRAGGAAHRGEGAHELLREERDAEEEEQDACAECEQPAGRRQVVRERAVREQRHGERDQGNGHGRPEALESRRRQDCALA